MSSTPSDRPYDSGSHQPDLETITVVAISEHVVCHVDGEAVVLHLAKGAYYGLNSVGTRVWSLIQSPMHASAIRDALLAEYDVEPSACEKDLKSLLDDLAKCGLIEIQERIADNLAV
jgi:Coenzyme PQQ synthesis protein D (PqqD)